ncbi:MULTISPECIES: DNA polymerase III subunit delta [unclassified Acinetobacter]|uniref:DNA polymerase III subunit delta n=1 Tax=unclassified Acinetobacter TaxID=196816 RepID=UPI0035BAD64D
MKLDYQQALQRIEQHRGVWLLHGAEPLLEQNLLTKFRKYWQDNDIERQRFELSGVQDWKQIFSALNSLSLFSTQLAIEVHGNIKPDATLLKQLKQFMQQPQDNSLIVVFPKQDSQSLKSAFVQSIEANGIVVNLNLYHDKDYEKILKIEAEKIGIHLSPDAWKWLLFHHENNLLSARNSLMAVADSLDDTTQQVDIGHLQQHLQDQSRYSSFDLGDACLKGDTVHALKILAFLLASGEAATLIFWVLQKEMRLLLQIFENPQDLYQLGIWKNQIPVYQQAIRRYQPKQLVRWSGLLLKTDAAIKGIAGSLPIEILLKQLVLELCGQVTD